MNYLTMLVFIATINGEDFPSPIPFTSEQKCEQALRATGDLYKLYDADWGDTMVGCVKTEVVTGYTIRPKARPWSN